MNKPLTEEDRLVRYQKGWPGSESICGTGSSVSRTGHIRKWIPEIVDKYGFKVINDAGAGDLNWVSHIQWKSEIDYQGYDIVQRHPDVIEIDTSKVAMRPCDMILCRMVQVHMSEESIKAQLELFRQSGKYLMATNFHTPEKLDNVYNDFFHVRLTDKQYGLGQPLETIADTNNKNDLALFKL